MSPSFLWKRAILAAALGLAASAGLARAEDAETVHPYLLLNPRRSTPRSAPVPPPGAVGLLGQPQRKRIRQLALRDGLHFRLQPGVLRRTVPEGRRAAAALVAGGRQPAGRQLLPMPLVRGTREMRLELCF